MSSIPARPLPEPGQVIAVTSATASFAGPDENAAVVGTPVGAGYAVLYGIEPTYRAILVQTGQPIAKLILHSAERRLPITGAAAAFD